MPQAILAHYDVAMLTYALWCAGAWADVHNVFCYEGIELCICHTAWQFFSLAMLKLLS